MLYSVAPRAGVRARGVLPAAIRGGGAARPNSHAPRETERIRFNPKGLPHPLRSGLRFGSSRRDVSSRVIFGPGTQVKEEEAGDKDDAATEEEPARRRLPFLRGSKTYAPYLRGSHRHGTVGCCVDLPQYQSKF